MQVLGIETSCDETAVALVEVKNNVLNVRESMVGSQVNLHARFGGVLPELATREHLKNLPSLLSQLMEKTEVNWSEIDLISVTAGPGLAPALLIGHSYARGLGLASGKPVVGINHLEGHLFSPFFSLHRPVSFPFVGLIVSGGHTLLLLAEDWNRYRKLGGTVDDAAGEAFDKVARLLNLPYPGGPAIEKLAREGNSETFDFPQSFPERDNFNFSFSGLKTAVRYFFEKNPQHHQDPKWRADLAASFQKAIVEVLTRKAVNAAIAFKAKTLVASGGVLCNHALQSALQKVCTERKIELLLAKADLCTDNAAMIAAVAAAKKSAGALLSMREDIDPNLSLFC